MAFNFAQLEGIWLNAGGNAQAAAQAAAVATAESSGDPNAHSPTQDVGLWQINLPTWGPSMATTDIGGNVRAAIKISNNGSTWRPWCTAWSDNACGSNGGAYWAPGSSALAAYNNHSGTPPDKNVPVNGTGAAAQNTQSANAGSGGGGGSGGNAVCNFLGHTPIFGGDIKRTCEGVSGALNPMTWVEAFVHGIINPIIQFVAGVFGLLAGGGLMIAGAYGLVAASNAGQQVIGEAEKGAGAAVAVGGAVAGQPEAVAAGGAAIERGGARQRGGRQGAQAARAQRAQAQRFRLAQQREQRLSTEQQLRVEAGQYAPPRRPGFGTAPGEGASFT